MEDWLIARFWEIFVLGAAILDNIIEEFPLFTLPACVIMILYYWIRSKSLGY